MTQRYSSRSLVKIGYAIAPLPPELGEGTIYQYRIVGIITTAILINNLYVLKILTGLLRSF
ncbi:hypothetical protein H6G36_26775 [Anabaena minutissima FACHB-250]|nr:hypothetical protein [Anabaena minutissima FACHB-250]